MAALARSRCNDEIFGKELRLTGHRLSLEINGLDEWAPAFAGDEKKFARLLMHADKRAEQICGKIPAPTTQARRGPGSCPAQNILFAENFGQIVRQCDWQFARCVKIRGNIQLFPGQPDFRFYRAEDFWREIKECRHGDGADRQGNDRVVINQRESAEYGDIFADAKSDIGKWFRRGAA